MRLILLFVAVALACHDDHSVAGPPPADTTAVGCPHHPDHDRGHRPHDRDRDP